MNKYRNRNERPKAFIGAAIGAATGLIKGIAGGIAKRKQARKEQQQNYVNAVMQSKQGMDEELQAAAELAGQFEEKFVARCGGRYKSKGVKMACGGSKKACGGRAKKGCGGKKKEYGGAELLTAPTMAQGNPMNINKLNSDLQSFNNQVSTTGSKGSNFSNFLNSQGSDLGGLVGGLLGGTAQSLIAGKPAAQFSTYKPNVRTQPLSNINTNKDVNNIPNNGATTDAMALPNGALQRPTAKFGSRTQRPTAMCGTRKRGKFGTRRRSC